MTDVRKTVFVRAVMHTDEMCKSCDPIMRRAPIAIIRNPRKPEGWRRHKPHSNIQFFLLGFA